MVDLSWISRLFTPAQRSPIVTTERQSGSTLPSPSVVKPTTIKEPRIGLYKHWSEAPWDFGRWPNFKPDEPNIACPLTGEFWYDPVAYDMLQEARLIFGRPFTINSCHRSIVHNAHVGGALQSMHLKIAFDVSTRGYNRFEVLDALRQAGFTTFGYYKSFIHTDRRPNRRWYGKGAKELWTS